MSDDQDQDEALFVTPPGSLADKAKTDGGGLDEAEMLRRAEEAVTALKGEYPIWVEGHLADLEKAYAGARANPDEGDVHLGTVAQIAHEVKGEGTTYGYPLMTMLGDSLCGFTRGMIEGKTQRSDTHLDIIGKHIEAMRVVIRDRIEGDGGELGQTLLASLEKAVAKFSN